MSPWIEAQRPDAAGRWLDESGVALRGGSAGQATVSATLDRQVDTGGSSSGQASVSGDLTIRRAVAGAAAGFSSVSGSLGYAYALEATSHGSSSVSGQLTIGSKREIEGSSAGKATVSGSLTVKTPYKMLMYQEGDSWGSGENLPPMGSARDDGPNRRRFTPHSVGGVTR